MAILQAPGTFSSVMGLGAVQQVYLLRKSNKWGSVIAAVLCLGGSAVVLFGGIWYTIDQWQRFGPAIIARTISVPILFSGILFLLGILAAWSAFSNWKKAVVLYMNGLAYSDRKGVQAWRWEEFGSLTSAVTKHYTNGIYTGTTHAYTLLKNDGSRIVLNDSLTNVEEVSNRIREKIFPLLYKRYADAYNAGQRVVFGPVALSKTEGLQVGKKIYPWDQVGQVSIHQGYVRISKKGGGWFSGATAAASMIPNVELLLSIVDQVVGVKAG
jgi:hypothetical protein